jgi:penicillin-binding protein 1A
VLVLACGVLAIGGLASLFWWYGRGVAGLDEASLRSYRPPQVTRVLARDGRLIGEIYSERRTRVPYDSIPSHVENAFLAAEDAAFYQHEGMDYFGMVRALLANVRAGEIRQGASTITQQVVKTFMLSPERTLERKVQELILARRLEHVLTKRKILELYLNEIYLGHGRYGIEEASRFYFGKSVAKINAGQAALLAAMPKAPGRDSPFQNPERAKRRQVYVLEQMAALGFAAPRDAKRYIKRPLELASDNNEALVVPGAAEFVDVVREELADRFGTDALETLGATVTTTVDLDLQLAARAAVSKGLVALDRRHAYGHGIRPAKPRNLERARKKGEGPVKVGDVRYVVIEQRPEDVSLPEEGFAGKIGDKNVFVRVPTGSRYDDPKLGHDEQFPVGGITRARVLRLAGDDAATGLAPGWIEAEIGSGPEAAMVLADVRTGEILAMIGGSDHKPGGFDRARSALRQPGSAFKPFVYGAALQGRTFTPATVVSDSPEIYEKWRPSNFEPDVYRGDIRLRVALTHSVNTVAIKVLDEIGVQAAHEFARAAGIESPLVENLSLALGTSEVTPLELMTGYMTLARGGSRIAPLFIKSIEVPGQSPWAAESQAEQTLPADVVFVLTSMMKSVVEEGTGKGAAALGRPAAGKTGTSADLRDAWFGGFTSQHVAVAWVGFDTPKRIGRGETGGRAALPIWLAAMQAAEKGKPAADFVPPPSVSVRTIEARTGLLAPALLPTDVAVEDEAWVTLEEYFVAGTEPVEEASPEALPADDVVLDLYGEGTPPATPPEPGEMPAEDPTQTGEDDASARKSAPLPSLDDAG